MKNEVKSMTDALATVSIPKAYIIHTGKYELVRSLVRVYERGQIVLPKHIRDMLHIAPGTDLSAHVEGNRIILEQSDFAQKLDEFRAKYATMTDKEVSIAIKKIEKEMHEEWLNVPGL